MLLTRKQLSERREALRQEATKLLTATKDREFTPEERTQRTRIESEMTDLIGQEQEIESRDRFSQMLDQNSSDPEQLAEGYRLPWRADKSRDNPFNRFKDYRMSDVFAHARKRDSYDNLPGLPGEIHKELEKEWRNLGAVDKNQPPNGLWLPHEMPVRVMSEQRSTDITNMAGSLTTVQEVTLIDVLRNSMVARQAGATVISGLSGTYEIPKKTLANTSRWVGESPSLVLTDMTSGKITFTPKTVTAASRLTHRLEEQSSYDVRSDLMNDIALAIAIQGDQAVFHGSGSSNQPLGIQGHTGVRTISIGTNGGDPTWAKIVECKSKRNKANAGLGRPVWVTSPMGLGKLETTAKVSGQTLFLSEDGKVMNYPVLESNQIKDDLDKGTETDTLTMLVFGDFSQVKIGLWGSVKVVIDPFTVQPDTIFSIYQTMDVQIVYPEALSKILDLKW